MGDVTSTSGLVTRGGRNAWRGRARVVLSRGVPRVAVVVVMLCGVLATSCSRDGEVGRGGEEEGIRRTFDRGPVTVGLVVDRKEPTIADRINLSIEVTADEGYEVGLPSFGEKLEQFGIVDYHTSQPVLLDKNRTRVTRSYVLEPFLSGDYVVPPMKVSFWKPGAEATPHELETETLTIHVKSLLPETVADLKIHDIVPPVELPARPWGWRVPAIAVVGLLALLGGVIWWKRRKRIEQTAERRVPAHELAFRELEKLVADDLIGQGEVKRFYQGISDILRRYIENRFGLHAPEQTTEEFLAALNADRRLATTYRALLSAFLGHCDLVKFAEHQPTRDDIQKTFDSCKAFVVGTQEEGSRSMAGPIRLREDSRHAEPHDAAAPPRGEGPSTMEMNDAL